MTLYQYKLLDHTDQACVLWNKGVFLCDRKNDQYIIALYQIDGFYVEVFYNREHNAIERLRSFEAQINSGPIWSKSTWYSSDTATMEEHKLDFASNSQPETRCIY